jgi:hypothetical protein
VDENLIYLRVIDQNGALVLIKDKDVFICDTIYFQSELSSFELLANQDYNVTNEMIGALQFKNELTETDFTTVQVKANTISQCALINDFNTIKVETDHGDFQLNEILKTRISSKALLFGRMTILKGVQKYVADIISYDE